MSDTIEDKLNLFLATSPSAQACRELAAALEHVLKNERSELANDIYTKDILPAIEGGKVKLQNMRSMATKASGYFSKIKAIVSEDGFDRATDVIKNDSVDAYESGREAAVHLYQTAKDNLPLLKKASVDFVDRIIADYDSLETDEERALYVAKLSMYLVIFGYGARLGNMVPDTDFKLWGPGAHRSFISHSTAPMLTVTALSIVMTRVLQRADLRLTLDSDARAYSDTTKTCLTLFTVGFGVGNAFHLAKDSTFDNGGTIRFHDFSGNSIGSLIPGTRADDLSYTTVMSFFSGQTSIEYNSRIVRVVA